MRKDARGGQRRDQPLGNPFAAQRATELIYGRNAVRESLRAKRRRIKRLLVADGVKVDERIMELEALADGAGIEVSYGDRQVLDDMTEGVNHQGVALEVGAYPYAEINEMVSLATTRNELPLVLLLDHLQDPQNLGTLLRTADVVGVHGVVFPERRAAAVTPSVVNASAGAVEHLLVAQVTNLNQAIEELKTHDIWIVGLEDDERAQEFDQVDLNRALGLVVGAEGSGLARLVRERCDFLMKLPMRGHVASLNAATAGSIALYHMWRSRPH